MTSTKKNLLFVTCHLPFPPYSGGRKREYELIIRLSKKFNIYLCSISKNYEEDIIYLNEMKLFCKEVKLFKARNESGATDGERSKLPLQIIRNSSYEAQEYINDIINSVDLVHVEGYYLMHLIPKKVPIVLGEQNIEYLLWLQRYHLEKAENRKNHYYNQYKLTKEFEVQAWKKSDAVVVLTNEDKDLVKKESNSDFIYLVPLGYDDYLNAETEDIKHNVYLENPSILYVGNFNYEPNIDAANYFCYEILPLIKRKIPKINIYLVGNNPNYEISHLSKIRGVHITGRVTSLKPYYKASNIFVCPLRIGGGIKVKMIEALLNNKAIITTSIGAQGLPQIEGDSYLIEDNPEKFAIKAIELLENNQRRESYENKTKILINNLPTWDENVTTLINCYNEIFDYAHMREKVNGN